METKYFTGAKVKKDSPEFRSIPADSPRDAVRVAAVASRNNYFDITLYAERDGKRIGIPYHELERLENLLEFDGLLRVVELCQRRLSA